MSGSTRTNLSQAMKDLLEDYTDEVMKVVDEVLQEVGEDASDELRNNASTIGGFKDRTGKYRKSWTVTHEEHRTFTSTTVHAKGPQYRLTHLLEYGHKIVGHAKREGGRTETDKYPHIYTVNEKAQEEAFKKITEAIEKIK